ncbi:hypothetical protein D3C87_2079110 [compost metagenome]
MDTAWCRRPSRARYGLIWFVSAPWMAMADPFHALPDPKGDIAPVIAVPSEESVKPS